MDVAELPACENVETLVPTNGGRPDRQAKPVQWDDLLTQPLGRRVCSRGGFPAGSPLYFTSVSLGMKVLGHDRGPRGWTGGTFHCPKIIAEKRGRPQAGRRVDAETKPGHTLRRD